LSEMPASGWATIRPEPEEILVDPAE
jgi:hypothetical protein